MKSILAAYLAALIAFVVVDLIWLATMADLIYRPLLGDKLARRFRLTPVIAFYLIYAGGIVHFAVLPALNGGNVAAAALDGAALGLVAYTTYQFTNLGTLRDWPLSISLADIVWGALLTAIASTFSFWTVSQMT
ncbi:MAG TPA: DUF2177 family protein [Ensifer sp.]|jgi:uncharacterized membrane protein|uniref:DUF2177 family protein n=1 Tax=Ensifer sp. TaxID=1872086 RepID=UPI002E13B87F|nr:DUF2177 family protein [Ensifer sp.]